MFGRIYNRLPDVSPVSKKADAYYERYRRGLIQRHICRNGRLLQAVLLVQERDGQSPIENTLHHNRRVTEEHTKEGSAYLYSAYPAILDDGHVIGGGDNPLLSGGLAMMMFSIESLLDVSAYSLDYATVLLAYFERSQVTSGQLYRRRNWWQTSVHVSKDEMAGLLLGLDFYLQATKKAGKTDEYRRARRLMLNVGYYLRDQKYSPAYTWVFQFPFTRLFKFNLGKSLLCGTTIPPNPGTGDQLMDLLVKVLKSMAFINLWYRPKHLYRDTMRYLRHAYQAATELDVGRRFYNVALYCHCSQMIFNKPVKRKVRIEMWKAFREMFNYFACLGRTTGQGEGSMNAYLGIVAHAFARSVGSKAVDSRAVEMYRSVLYPENIWAPNLPLCCLEGATPTLKHYYGSADRYWGERFTWEHRDPKGHVLDWTWDKAQGSLGPPSRTMLQNLAGPPYYHVDPSKGFVVEACGLGLPVARALAAYYGLAAAPKLTSDISYNVLSLDGPSP